MLGKLELLAQASHEVIEEWLTIVGDDVPEYAKLIDNVCLDEANNVLFFYFRLWNCFCPFREVISSSEDVGVTTR